MTLAPQNTDELNKRIGQQFSSQLATQLSQYFVRHQFDEWKDIYDDINNGYNACCCKIVLFEQLNITNTESKHNQYERLRQCLYPPKIVQNPVPDNEEFGGIFADIIKVFTIRFNAQIADIILHLFANVLKQEEFDDVESVTDDIDDIDNSAILAYVTEQIDYNRINKTREITKDTIIEGIQQIVKKQFIPEKADQNKPKIPKKYDRNKPVPKIPSVYSKTVEDVSQEMSTYFTNMLGAKRGNKIAELFEDIVNDQEFEDMDAVKDDFEEDSIILSYLMKQIGQQLTLNKEETKMVSTNIEEIVSGNAKPTEIPKPPQPKIESIKRKIRHQFKADIASKILKEFNKIIAEGEFVDDNLEDDVEDIENSAVLNSLDSIPEISNNEKQLRQYQGRLKDIILSVLIKHLDINIKSFIFDVNRDEIKEAAEFLNTYCQTLYPHLMGVANQITEQDLHGHRGHSHSHSPRHSHSANINRNGGGEEKKSKVESTSLAIVKAIDHKNDLKPITLWLLNLFSKDRSRLFREGRNEKEEYSVAHWWTESKFGQYVEKEHQNMARHIKAGLSDFVKRLLVPINNNYEIFSVIADRLDAFVEYALAFHRTACSIKREMQNGKCAAAPIQIDYCIIPQMVKQLGGEDAKKKCPYDPAALSCAFPTVEAKYIPLALGDIEEVLTDPKCGYVKGTDFFVMELETPGGFERLHRKHMLLDMIKQYKGWKQRRNRYIFIIDRRHPDNIKDKKMPRPAVYDEYKKDWNDKIYLIAPKQYRRDGDSQQAICICGEKLIKKRKSIRTNCGYCKINKVNEYSESKIDTVEMWSCSKKTGVHPYGYNLCIGCNKVLLCICGQRLKCIEKAKVKAMDTRCKWCGKSNAEADVLWKCGVDCGYILCDVDCEKERPDTFSRLSEQWECVPESCFGLSKNYILWDHPNSEKKPITMDEAMDGYMFGLSYHILREDNISVYWYRNVGGTLFELGDIPETWPQWFEKRNGKRQEINKQNMPIIDRWQNHGYLDEGIKLRNVDFENFEKQCETL